MTKMGYAECPYCHSANVVANVNVVRSSVIVTQEGNVFVWDYMDTDYEDLVALECRDCGHLEHDPRLSNWLSNRTKNG